MEWLKCELLIQQCDSSHWNWFDVHHNDRSDIKLNFGSEQRRNSGFGSTFLICVESENTQHLNWDRRVTCTSVWHHVCRWCRLRTRTTSSPTGQEEHSAHRQQSHLCAWMWYLTTNCWVKKQTMHQSFNATWFLILKVNGCPRKGRVLFQLFQNR